MRLNQGETRSGFAANCNSAITNRLLLSKDSACGFEFFQDLGMTQSDEEESNLIQNNSLFSWRLIFSENTIECVWFVAAYWVIARLHLKHEDLPF